MKRIALLVAVALSSACGGATVAPQSTPREPVANRQVAVEAPRSVSREATGDAAAEEQVERDPRPHDETTCGFVLFGCESEACTTAAEAEQRERHDALAPILADFDRRERAAFTQVNRAVRAGQHASALTRLDAIEARLEEDDPMFDFVERAPRVLAYRGLIALRLAERAVRAGDDGDEDGDADSLLDDAVAMLEKVIEEAADPERRGRAAYHLDEVYALQSRELDPDEQEGMRQERERALRTSLCLRDHERVRRALALVILDTPRDPLSEVEIVRRAIAVAPNDAGLRARLARAEQDRERPVAFVRRAFRGVYPSAEAFCDNVESDGGVRCFASEAEQAGVWFGEVCDVDQMEDHLATSDDCVTSLLVRTQDGIAEFPESITPVDDALESDLASTCQLRQFGSSIVCRLNDEVACFSFAGTFETSAEGLRLTRALDGATNVVDPASLCTR